MKESRRLVERADPNAVGAIRTVGGPKRKTGFRIDVPCMYALPVGDVVRLCTWLRMHEGLAGAFLSALSTDHAKIPDAEFDGAVRYQGQICKDLGQSNPRTVLRGNEQSVSPKLPESCINGNRNAAGRIISTSYGPVSQTSDIMRCQTCHKRHFRISQAGGCRSWTCWGTAYRLVIHLKGKCDGIFIFIG